MKSDLKTSILYKCPICGEIQKYDLNVFSFSGNKAVILSCKCKKSYITITVGKQFKYTLSSPCIACNEFHKFETSAKTFWNSDIICFTCPALEADLFYSGDIDKINQECIDYNDETELIMNQLGFDNLEEENPFVTSIADYLKSLSSKKLIGCNCTCNDIKMQVFFDRVEMLCSSCLTKTVIEASSNDDLENIKKHKKLTLKRAKMHYK